MTQLIHTFTLIHKDGTQASASMPAVPGPDVASAELQTSVDQLRDFSLQMGKAMEKRIFQTNVPLRQIPSEYKCDPEGEPR